MAVLSRHALRTPETFERWLEVYAAAVEGLPSRDLPACPNCGHFDLQLEFVADPKTRIGFAALWSPNCGRGVRLSRIQVPAAADFVPLDAPDEVIAERVPAFTEVQPTGSIAPAPALTAGEAAVLQALEPGRPLTSREIAARVKGMSSSTVRRELRHLVDYGVVVGVGGGRTRRYVRQA